jgi:hypothetical protein
MLDNGHIPLSTKARVWRCDGNTVAAGATWTAWQRQRGESMAYMLLLGSGAGGGTGVVGANSVSAGGGGGGSGGQSRLTIPLFMLPDQLFVSVPYAAAGAGVASYISVAPNNTTNHLLLHAAGGGVGGNAAAGTGGAAGAAASISTIATAPLGGLGDPVYLAGQAGIIGGAAVAGAALTLPVTGLIVTGGTGGGGLPAAAATGTNGGSFTVPAAPGIFAPQSGGIGSATATLAAAPGSDGFMATNLADLMYFYGGTGGASTHGTATGAGLTQARGGNGGQGCGGGGMGGALTASAAAAASLGGPGLCIIISW